MVLTAGKIAELVQFTLTGLEQSFKIKLANYSNDTAMLTSYRGHGFEKLEDIMSRTTLYNRHEALERAIQLFWQKGFHATSLKDIEQALDMRPGSIYAAFGNKDGLFQEALDHYANASLTELERILASHESPLLGLAAYMRQLGGICDQEIPSRACMLVKSLLELGAREQSALDKVEKLLAGMETRFTKCFVEAKRLGELDNDLDATRLGRRLQAEVMGLRAFAQRDVDTAAVQALAEDMATSIENMRNGAFVK